MPAAQSSHNLHAAPPSRSELLDKDVLSFVYRQPHLTEFAFQCADHGVIHVGALVQMSEAHALSIAEGDEKTVRDMRDRLSWSGLSFGMALPEWTDPDAGDEELEQ